MNKTFNRAIDQEISQLELALKSLKQKDVPALFWLANSWGSYVNLNKTDVNLFFGSLLASKPRMFGGNPEKAKEHFNTCFRINENKFLMAKYLFAKTYTVQQQDRDLFKRVLNEIINAPIDLLPEQRLANEIARKKATLLLEQEEDLFF